MAVKITYRGIKFNAPLKTDDWAGKDVREIVALPYVQGLKAGSIVTLDENGVKLAADASTPVLGVLLNDADGYFYENKPSIASGLIAVAYGECGYWTDQVAEGTYKCGDLLTVAEGKLKAAGDGDTAVAMVTDKGGITVSETSNPGLNVVSL